MLKFERHIDSFLKGRTTLTCPNLARITNHAMICHALLSLGIFMQKTMLCIHAPHLNFNITSLTDRTGRTGRTGFFVSMTWSIGSDWWVGRLVSGLRRSNLKLLLRYTALSLLRTVVPFVPRTHQKGPRRGNLLAHPPRAPAESSKLSLYLSSYTKLSCGTHPHLLAWMVSTSSLLWPLHWSI